MRRILMTVLTVLAASCLLVFSESISGKLTDPDGRPIAGARISVLQGKKLVADSKSDERGHYLFANLNPGAYRLTARWTHLHVIREDILLSPGQPLQLDLVLDLAPLQEQVVVTATRTETPLALLGNAVTVITSEEMEARGAHTVSEVLEGVAGFNVARTGASGGATSVFVRGGESDFNLVLIDGVQVNQPGGAFDFADLTTANVDRIEIVVGPSSVLYGADAVTSTIQIITKSGEGPPSGSLSFQGGSFQTYSLRGGVQGGSKRIHYSLGGDHLKSDGFYAFNNQYDNGEISGKVDFELNPSSSVSTSLRYADSTYHFPTDSTGAVVDPNDFRRSNSAVATLVYRNKLTSQYKTQIQYGYSRRGFRSFTVRDDIVDFFDSRFQAVDSRHTLDWQNELRVDDQNLVTAGVSFEREETETDHQDRRSIGFFLQEQFSWAERFFVTAGVRYDNNDRFENFTTGNLSLGYLINDEWKVRGSLGNGFRAPGYVEILGFPSFGILGNPNLKPEKNFAADFGFEHFSKNPRASLSGSVFFNRFSDLIEFSFLVASGMPNYLNIEKAKSQGVELQGFIDVTDTLRLGGHYTLTDTEVTDAGTVPGGSFAEGESLLRRPRHAAGIYAQFRRNRYKVRLDFRFKGARDDIQFFPDFSSARVTLPSYWKTDAAVTIPLLGSNDSVGELAAILRGRNLFNKPTMEVAGFESIGRSLMAGLEIRF